MSSFFTSTDYPVDYKEECFYAWYKAGKPKMNFMRYLPISPDGRKPNISTVKNWMKGGDGWQNWEEHAYDLDVELAKKLDKDAIEERARIVKELAKTGDKLIEKGMEALEKEEPFKDNPAAAVRAVTSGVEIKFKYSGMAASLLMISSMNDKQLTKEALRLLGKNENTDEIIEVDSEDIPSEEDDDSSPEDD